MDNDNEVLNPEEQRHKDVLLFLQQELEPLKIRNSVSSYNLEQEYAKTKKNKSVFVPVVLISSILVIGLVSFFLTRSIEKTDREIAVNVADFDDVNLKNLVDTVARTQDQYEAAVKNKVQIESQKKSQLNAAADKRDSDLFTISSLNLRDKNDKARREATVQKEYANAVKEIEAEYNPLIEEADSEIEIYKTKLDEYDNAKIAAAQEQQKALDSERQLQELERRRMAEKYEERISSLEETIARNRKTYQDEIRSSLKSVSGKLQSEIDSLDPIINDSKADEILLSPALNNRRIYDFENHEVFIAGNISDTELADEMRDVRKMYQDYKYLDKRILDLPHKFSIGEYKIADDKMIEQISSTMADEVYSLYRDKVSLKQEVVTLNENIEKMKKDHEEEVLELNQNHAAEVASLNKAREDEVKSLNSAHEKEVKTLKQEAQDTLYSFMQSAGYSAVVESAASVQEIYVIVRPNARYLINEETGCKAEIPLKKTVKGFVVKMPDGKFRFEPDKDKAGNYVPVDLTLLSTGFQIKLKEK